MQAFTVQSERKVHAVDITGQVTDLLTTDINGIACLFTPHTTAALIVGENEKDLIDDLERTAAHLLDACGPFRHAQRGNPNAPAHIFSSLAGASLWLPVEGGRLKLGTYQRVLLLELDGPKARQVWLTYLATVR